MAFPSTLNLLYDIFLRPFGYPMPMEASSPSVTIASASGDGDANVLPNYVDASTSPHVFTRPLTPSTSSRLSAPPQPNPVQVENASSTPADVAHCYADHFQALSVRQTHQRVMDLHNDLRARHEDMMCAFEWEKEQMQKLVTASAELLEQTNLMIARQDDRWREEWVRVAQKLAAAENENAFMDCEVGGKVERKSPEATRRHQGIVDGARKDEKERHTVKGLADYNLRYTRAMESSNTLPNSPSDSDYLSGFRNPLAGKTLVCLTASVPSPQDPPPRSSLASKVKLPPAPLHSVVPQSVAATDVAWEPVAPLKVSANRWTPASRIRQSFAAEKNSPAIVDRKVKALLNKLTMEKFDSISDQIISWTNKSETENDARTLIQVTRLVFEKATDEAAWSEMYARLCRKMMEQISPKVQVDVIRSSEGKHGGQLFRKYLLNHCQEDFERNWASKDAAAAAAAAKAGEDKAAKDKADAGAEDEIALYSDEYYAAQKAKRQGLGLIKFVGELFMLQMLTERIMHECVKKLLRNVANPDEEEIESLCTLLTTVGAVLDSPKAHAHMDVYFSRMEGLTKSPNIALRLRFKLQDVIYLRSRRWMSRDDYDVWCIIAGARCMLRLRLGPVYPQSTLDMVAKAAHDWEEAHAGKQAHSA